MLKCENCYWKSELYAYYGDCHYHFLGNKGQCKFIAKSVMQDIEHNYSQRLIEAEQERNLAIINMQEDCDDEG